MALFLFSKLGTWRSWPILWWMVECYTQWLLLQLHFPKKHWIAYRPWRIAQSLGELGTYVYRMHILYIYMCTFHTHTSFHGHDFELRNISRHLQGKKRVKIVCFSRLVSVASDLFHCQRRDTPSSGLMCLWPCRRRAPRSRCNILVRFLHLPKSLIDTLLLNVLGKMMKGSFGWQNGNEIWFSSNLERKSCLGAWICRTIRRYIGSTPYSECQSPPGFLTSLSLHFPLASWLGGLMYRCLDEGVGRTPSTEFAKAAVWANQGQVNIYFRWTSWKGSFQKNWEMFLGEIPCWKLTN